MEKQFGRIRKLETGIMLVLLFIAMLELAFACMQLVGEGKHGGLVELTTVSGNATTVAAGWEGFSDIYGDIITFVNYSVYSEEWTLMYYDISTGTVTNTGVSVTKDPFLVWHSIYDDLIVNPGSWAGYDIGLYNISDGIIWSLPYSNIMDLFDLVFWAKQFPSNIISIYGDIIAFFDHEGVWAYDITTASIIANLTTSSPGDTWGVSVYENFIAFSDGFIQYYDLSTNTTTNTGVVGIMPSIHGDIIAFVDPMEADSIIGYYNISSGQVSIIEDCYVWERNRPSIYGDVIVFSTSEQFIDGGRDVNDDGDVDDMVVRYYNMSTGTLVNTGEIGNFPTIYGDTIVFDTKESWVDTDLNDDGDTDDCVVRFVGVYPVHKVYPVHNIGSGLDYETIQEAIDAPETLDGHTIRVDAGTYYEHVTIDKSLSLIGADKFNTIIDGSGTGNVINITADNVNINGFTIQNSGSLPYYSGIYVDEQSTGNDISYNTIIDNELGIYLYWSSNNTIFVNDITNNEYGIWLTNSLGNTISRNIITGNEVSGIHLEDSSNYNRISENDIINNYIGIKACLHSNYNTILGNEIADNVCGIDLSAASSNNIISENNIEFNECGIGIDPYSNNTVYHNNFIENTDQALTYLSVNNVWDHDGEGNFWSDYMDRYPDAGMLGDLYIWDTPYVIDEDNQDNYPLMIYFTIEDLNNDAKVDIMDIARVAKAFGSEPGDERWDEKADLDYDGKVTILDIARVAKKFGWTASWWLA